MCDYVVEGEQRLQVQVELSDVVTGSVVDREVIAINDGSKIIFFLDQYQILLKRGCMLIKACSLKMKRIQYMYLIKIGHG